MAPTFLCVSNSNNNIISKNNLTTWLEIGLFQYFVELTWKRFVVEHHIGRHFELRSPISLINVSQEQSLHESGCRHRWNYVFQQIPLVERSD